MDLIEMFRRSSNELTAALDRLAVLENKARDQHNEFIHECLQKRRKRNRNKTESEDENAYCKNRRMERGRRS